MILATPSATTTMARKPDFLPHFPVNKRQRSIICAYVHGMLQGGFLHTTSERGEGYIAYKLPKEKMGFQTLWPIAKGMLRAI